MDRRAEAMRAAIEQARAFDASLPARQEFPITPVPKPRMTQRDKWAKRPCVLRYRAFADELRVRGAKLPHSYYLTFVLPMPASWPASKRSALCGCPHLSRPDVLNLAKAVEDALVAKDEVLYRAGADKVWGEQGAVIIERRDPIRPTDP